MSNLNTLINGFDALSGAAFGGGGGGGRGGGGGGGGPRLPPSILHTQVTNPHVPIREQPSGSTGAYGTVTGSIGINGPVSVSVNNDGSVSTCVDVSPLKWVSAVVCTTQ